MDPAVRFQETLRRLTMIDEGFVEDQSGLGIDPPPPSALDLARPGAVKSFGVLQTARRSRRPSRRKPGRRSCRVFYWHQEFAGIQSAMASAASAAVRGSQQAPANGCLSVP
jgi:hypothetical protein